MQKPTVITENLLTTLSYEKVAFKMLIKVNLYKLFVKKAKKNNS